MTTTPTVEFVLRMAVAAAATLAIVSSNGAELAIPPKLDRAADASLELSGPVRRRIDAVVENWLLRAPDLNPGMLRMFAERDTPPHRNWLPWSGEFAGKYLTAATQVLRVTHDRRLAEYLQAFVDRLVALQASDGYLGPFPKEFRLSGKDSSGGATWDAWGHYHVMIGLLLWHEQTHDAKALQCAERIGDLLCERFLARGKRVFDIGSPDQNQAVIHSLALLYEATGKKKYLELARQIVGEFETPGAGDYRRTALAGKEYYATPKPRWESLHAILGLAELHRITGDDDDRRAFEHIWWSIAKLDRHNNGGFSSGEQAVGNPYSSAPIETCCTIAWMAASVEMLRMTGNPVVADELELSTLNSVVGTHSPDGKWTTYNTPMDGRRIPNTTDIAFQIRPGTEGLNCCSVNAARGFGLISDWALMREAAPPGAKADAALVLNWYGPSTITTKVGDVAVVLKQETTYPRDGHIELIVEPTKPAQFALKLRIPSWSAVTRLSINGERIEAQPGTYCTLEREWKSGDRAVLDLDMSLRVWSGERECAGKVSLYRGPLLLAWEAPSDENKQPPSIAVAPTLDLKKLQARPVGNEKDPFAAIVLLDVTAADGRMTRLRDFGTAGAKKNPYFSWLPAKADPPPAFSKTNPLRTVPLP